jgi:death-on-curing protein
MEVALAVHEALLSEHGGAAGIRDLRLLDAALVAPRNRFAYKRGADRVSLAAVYAHALTRNHPFVDGNKRVALTLAGVFLELNGLRLEAPEDEAAQAVRALSEREINEKQFERWLRSRCSKIRSVGPRRKNASPRKAK